MADSRLTVESAIIIIKCLCFKTINTLLLSIFKDMDVDPGEAEESESESDIQIPLAGTTTILHNSQSHIRVAILYTI